MRPPKKTTIIVSLTTVITCLTAIVSLLQGKIPFVG